MTFKEYYRIKEMAVAGFGKYKGKHINDIDSDYANWLLKSIENDKARMGSLTNIPLFYADDGSGKLDDAQVMQALELRSKNKTVAPTSKYKPIRQSGLNIGANQKDNALFDNMSVMGLSEFKKLVHLGGWPYGDEKISRIMFEVMVKSYTLFNQKPELFNNLKSRFDDNYAGESIEEIDPEYWYIIFTNNSYEIIGYLLDINNSNSKEDLDLDGMKRSKRKLHLFNTEFTRSLQSAIVKK